MSTHDNSPDAKKLRDTIDSDTVPILFLKDEYIT
jgi:hypothetical protein